MSFFKFLSPPYQKQHPCQHTSFLPLHNIDFSLNYLDNFYHQPSHPNTHISIIHSTLSSTTNTNNHTQTKSSIPTLTSICSNPSIPTIQPLRKSTSIYKTCLLRPRLPLCSYSRLHRSFLRHYR